MTASLNRIGPNSFGIRLISPIKSHHSAYQIIRFTSIHFTQPTHLTQSRDATIPSFKSLRRRISTSLQPPPAHPAKDFVLFHQWLLPYPDFFLFKRNHRGDLSYAKRAYGWCTKGAWFFDFHLCLPSFSFDFLESFIFSWVA